MKSPSYLSKLQAISLVRDSYKFTKSSVYIKCFYGSRVHRKMINKTKSENGTIPSIKITLTTFTDDEKGEIAGAIDGTVKIDGEDDCPKGFILDFPVFKSVLVKNLFILSVGQFLLFLAFDSLSNLQSTVNSKENLGAISLAVSYGGLTISSFFLPSAIIKCWGCKRTLVLATISFCPFIVANYYPTWWTLIPTAFTCGLASGPLWTARSAYLNKISYRYAKLQKFSVGIVNACFFSVCTTFRQNTEIWGNLLSHYTLKLSHENESHLSMDYLNNCGPEFYDDGTFDVNQNIQLPSDGRWHILITVFIALTLIATFFQAFFLDSLESQVSNDAKKQNFSTSDFFSTLYQLFDTSQILLLPLSLYTGLVNGFYSGDYKKAYIACAWGVPHIAVVSICYGVVSSLVDIACAPCIQVLGRASLFILAALAHLAMFLALLLWKPNSEHLSGFFLIASAHGIGNGVWMSQLDALYGILFRDNEEAGFSCHYFLSSLGYLLAYSYTSYLHTNTKIYIPLAILFIALLSYLVVEVRLLKKALAEYTSRRPQKEID